MNMSADLALLEVTLPDAVTASHAAGSTP
jgi:hypothetical protein